MPHEGCSEVLRDPCALTLGDEPLTGGVEHGAVQFWMSLPEFCVPLHNCKTRSNTGPQKRRMTRLSRSKNPPVCVLRLFGGREMYSVEKTKSRAPFSDAQLRRVLKVIRTS